MEAVEGARSGRAPSRCRRRPRAQRLEGRAERSADPLRPRPGVVPAPGRELRGHRLPEARVVGPDPRDRNGGRGPPDRARRVRRRSAHGPRLAADRRPGGHRFDRREPRTAAPLAPSRLDVGRLRGGDRLPRLPLRPNGRRPEPDSRGVRLRHRRHVGPLRLRSLLQGTGRHRRFRGGRARPRLRVPPRPPQPLGPGPRARVHRHRRPSSRSTSAGRPDADPTSGRAAPGEGRRPG